jgi:ATP-binding protein involved in chromosome partitioning
MIDPRRSVVEKRLTEVRRIAAFCSAKGGVGKTVCAALSALLGRRHSLATGLLDLDFQGASAHIVLGADPHFPEEREGILPLHTAEGVSLMTVSAFTGERALPLRGLQVTDAILELLAVTQWGALDQLFIDMPPGIGDEVLDLITLIPRMEAVVVSTPSIVSVAVVERLVCMLVEAKLSVAGVLANMSRGDSRPVSEMARRCGVPFAGEIPYDVTLERAIGNPAALLECMASKSLENALVRMGLFA